MALWPPLSPTWFQLMRRLCCCGTGGRCLLCYQCQQQACRVWWHSWAQSYRKVRAALCLMGLGGLSCSKLGCHLGAGGHICCFWWCLKRGQGTTPNPGSCSSACASASASKQRTCPATSSNCDHHYKDNHSYHICSAHHLHHTAFTEKDHCCTYYACNNHQGYYNTDHHQPVHPN